ncbi:MULTISPECIES: hypothetical protein [Bacillota]|uniref:hypothetical protein n=1 Tax=Bacillota TaxID=1239 RepID=UPI0039EF9569
MADKIQKKVKGFRISPDLNLKLEDIIKESGKDEGEWFEDLILQISANELVLEKSGVPSDLRKHFSSDLAAIKDATNSITSLFLNQMNRIAVEKNNWNQFLQEKVDDYEKRIRTFKNDIGNLEQTIQNKDSEIHDANSSILQLQNKVDGFDKLEAQLRKEILRLEEENEKNSLEVQRIREESITEREKLYKDFDDLKTSHKEEKDRLNQQIVDLVDQLKKVEPLADENKDLQEKMRELEVTLKRNSAEYEMKLTRAEEQAEIDKQKALLARERELRDALYAELRDNTKELYEKIEKLQAENSRLQLENTSLKNKKWPE